jgi:hypothetical protein
MLPILQFLRAVLAAVACFAPLLAGCATLPSPTALSCTRPLDAKVSNSCVVNEQTLWRGARPDATAAATLIELGVRTVVSLELLNDDRAAFEAAKPRSAGAQEVQYFQIRDWEPLVLLAPHVVDEHVAHFLAVTRTQPKPIFVHCRSGQNRTGIMVAAYRIFNGADIEATVLEMQKYGGFWSEADSDYIRTLSPLHREAIERRIDSWMSRIAPTAKIACAEGRCVMNSTQK